MLAPLAVLMTPLPDDLPLPDLPATGAAPLDAIANGRLVRAGSDVYLHTGRFRRWVTALRVFDDYRFRWGEVQEITSDDLSAIPRGPDLIAGPVLRAPDGVLWIVLDGARRRVAGADAFAPLNLSPADAVAATGDQLATYPVGRPVGNPRRLWLGPALAATAAVGAVLWGRGASWRVLTLVVAAATSLRLCYVLLFPWFPDGADAGSYASVAHYLMSGKSLLERDPTDSLIGITSPLYSAILAALAPAFALAGEIGWKSAQAFVAAGLAVVTALLANRLFGERVAKAALLISSLSPAIFLSAELIQYELWLALFISTGLLGTLQLLDRPPAPFRVLIAGVPAGLAILTQVKVAVALAPPLVALTLARDVIRSRARSIALALLVSMVAILPVSAWAARNVVIYGEPIVGSIYGGVIFWMGNHHGATGGIMQVGRPQEYYVLAEQRSHSGVTREARIYAELAWTFIADHPSSAALLAFRKLERFWWAIDPERLGAHVALRTSAFLGGGPDRVALVLGFKVLHALSMAAAAAGLVWGDRTAFAGSAALRARRRHDQLVVLATLSLFWLVHAPFISEPRYRLPVLPLIHVFEAAGLTAGWLWIRSRVRSAEVN